MTTVISEYPRAAALVLPPGEALYVGVDVGKQQNVAGFLSNTLLSRHERFEGCPAVTFAQSREGYRQLTDRIRAYVPLEQCFVLLEKTGHYHKALEQYLLELDISVYLVHVQERMSGLMKTDKRAALGLANHLYNQLEKGIQVANKMQLVRTVFPPTDTAAQLKSMVRHRYELIHESTQRRNKLTAICDELFPEFTQVFKDPNRDVALCYRETFPTPHVLATASMISLCEARKATFPSNAKLVLLQKLASQSIGTKDVYRQRGLVFEQTLLIKELRLLREHLKQLDEEINRIVENSREGKILLSIPPVGTILAANILAAIGNIANFKSAASLKSYFGWAPAVSQTGSTTDKTSLSRAGVRTTKMLIYMLVLIAIHTDTEWARSYERLVPRKCTYDDRLKKYRGKRKVIGRIAGQMISLIYALLKTDQEVISKFPSGATLPDPILYDRATHKRHREGMYFTTKPKLQPNKIILIPND